MSMISGQVDRLRTAAQTYRRLGNHSAESMLLDAADTIWELQAKNAKLRDELENARMRGDDLASSIREWRAVTEARGQTIDRLAAENAKLRELVKDYIDAPCTPWYCWQDEFRCWNYDGADCGLVARARELGVEVNDG